MSTRNLNLWVAIAEITSAVAVVLSLIYVGLEIRRTTMESDADIQAKLLTYTHQRRVLVDAQSWPKSFVQEVDESLVGLN